ncbi:hypothetical protein CXB51_025936 [Gossypium anomalum]|uniref:Cytochrome P450 n=1 Tax=Gossypium anomalum TaxID=47600 RepID=A0A8J5YEP3_9ROSI|nr:hypothetical protein CXB51_025936 [Gossypium anomalum]
MVKSLASFASRLFLNLFLNFIKRSKLKLPPSPPKLPIIGNLHQIGTLPHRSFRTLSTKYGPLMLLHIGHTPTLVVSSAELAEEMVRNHDIVFSNRPITTAVKILLYGCKQGFKLRSWPRFRLRCVCRGCGHNECYCGHCEYRGREFFTYLFEYWRQARKICVLHLLSLKRVQSFQFVREEEVLTLINKIRGRCHDARPINMTEMLLGTSHNIISRCGIGLKGDEEGGSGARFGEVTRRFMHQISEFNVGDMFPSLGWLDVLSGFIGRLKETAKEMDEFLDKVIEEHMALKSYDEKDFVHRDLNCGRGRVFGCVVFVAVADITNAIAVIASIAVVNFSHTYCKTIIAVSVVALQSDGMLGTELTRDHFKAILADMFVAGTESVATATEWTMAELMRHPNIMKKAQDEVRKVVGKKPKIDAEDIHHMDYLKCIIKETLRLHPPAPLMSPRQTSTSVKLGDYHIPPKQQCL